MNISILERTPSRVLVSIPKAGHQLWKELKKLLDHVNQEESLPQIHSIYVHDNHTEVYSANVPDLTMPWEQLKYAVNSSNIDFKSHIEWIGVQQVQVGTSSYKQVVVGVKRNYEIPLPEETL